MPMTVHPAERDSKSSLLTESKKREMTPRMVGGDIAERSDRIGHEESVPGDHGVGVHQLEFKVDGDEEATKHHREPKELLPVYGCVVEAALAAHGLLEERVYHGEHDDAV